MKRLRDARLVRTLEERKRRLLVEMRELGDSDDDRLLFGLRRELSSVESDIERYRTEGESDD